MRIKYSSLFSIFYHFCPVEVTTGGRNGKFQTAYNNIIPEAGLTLKVCFIVIWHESAFVLISTAFNFLFSKARKNFLYIAVEEHTFHL